MASRGLLGAMAGLGQGVAQAGQTMGEVLKFQYLQDLRAQEKQEERAYQETQQQKAIDREDAKAVVKTEMSQEGGKHFKIGYNAKGEEVAREQFTPESKWSVDKFGRRLNENTGEFGKGDVPLTGDGTPMTGGGTTSGGTSSKRQYLDPRVEAEIEGIDKRLDYLYKRSESYPEDTKVLAEITDLERRRSARINGGDARSAKDITSEVVDNIVFDGSGRGLLRDSVRQSAAPSAGADAKSVSGDTTQKGTRSNRQPPQAAIDQLRAEWDDPESRREFEEAFGVKATDYIKVLSPKQKAQYPNWNPNAETSTFSEDVVDPVAEKLSGAIQSSQQDAQEYAAREMYDAYKKRGGYMPVEHVQRAWPYLSDKEKQEAYASLGEEEKRRLSKTIAAR